MAWSLKPGDKIARKDLHNEFEGSRQGGMTSAANQTEVFLFTDKKIGEQHGYFDGWQPDGSFDYTGTGQRGDQEFKSGNKTLLNHWISNARVRLFDGAKGEITYIGEFELDREAPFKYADAPETNNGPLRQVIVFKLWPVDKKLQPLNEVADQPNDPTQGTSSEVVDLERHNVDAYSVSEGERNQFAERKEAKLVKAFFEFSRRNSISAKRNKIKITGEKNVLFTDVYLPDLSLLIEAKGTPTREAIRMAIGQLTDYRRFLASADPNLQCAILLPSKPREDLLELIKFAEMTAIWPEEQAFVSYPREVLQQTADQAA
ncbi:hypothetical protein [Roseibium sp. SCP14]|uniref:hypothetical protein n=1 Tax=Roseibium sp. SCP14 TaxID=3141375 RepID=UPI00333B5BF8